MEAKPCRPILITSRFSTIALAEKVEGEIGAATLAGTADLIAAVVGLGMTAK